MGKSTGPFRILLISLIALYFSKKVSSDVIIGGTQIVGQTVYSSGKVVNQYLAIPYAEPPIGELRFKKPAPIKTMSDIYTAVNHPPACWQKSKYPFPWYDYAQTKNEDCLYLNIWTPNGASTTNKKAVIYFIHDGGFRLGSIGQKVYNGAPLAAHGDVIVVTVNYRLETFGFLTSGTKDAPGNIGLYDILAGLKWVNKNIENFGGDKSKITLAGIGSGSIAAGMLTISPLAKGLFQRTIMGSGSPAYPNKDAIQQNINISQKVAESLSCANSTHTIENNPSEVVKCLRSVSPMSLALVSSKLQPSSSVLFVPQFGDELLPKDNVKLLKNEDLTCNNLLIGNTNDEGSYQLTTQYPTVYGFFGSLNPAINKTIGKKELKQLLSEFPEHNAVVKHYLPDSIPGQAYDTVRKQVYTALGDRSIVCPTTFYAEQCASTGGDVYYYVWNHRSSKSVWFPWMGVAHGTDIPFVFGLPLLDKFNYKPEEMNLSKNIIQIWSSFAKNGMPSIPWPEFSKENPQVKVLGPGATEEKDHKGFHRENCNFFRPYFGFQTMWDILEGLKWVNQNIVYFGGDPTRITIAGESTGSNVVGVFSTSPLTKGLYRRQIMQSGSPTELQSANLTANLIMGQKLAKMVGCADDDVTIENNPKSVVECLKRVDPLSLSKADFLLVPRKNIAFFPVYGDEFLPEDPRKIIFNEKFPCTELLIGNNQDEGSYLITIFNQELFGFFGEKKAVFTKEQAKDRIRKIFQNFTKPEAVVNHYLPEDFPEDDYPGIRQQLYTSLGDKVFVCPDVYHAEKCAENGGKVYFYWWTHQSSTSPWAPWMGAAHFTELDYIFGRPLLKPSDYESRELEISAMMVEIWSSFVKNGKPSFHWPLYSRKNPFYKSLGSGTTSGNIGLGPHKSNCDFFRPYFQP